MNEMQEAAEMRLEMKVEAANAILYALNDYPVGIWGDALGMVVAFLFQSKLDAAEIAQGEKARQEEV